MDISTVLTARVNSRRGVVDVVDLFQKLKVTSQHNQQRPPAPQHPTITQNVGDFKLRKPGLPGTEEIAGAADLEVGAFYS